MIPLTTLLSEAVARLKRERSEAHRDTSLPLGACVRPGHPAACEVDDKVGCVRWKASPDRPKNV